LSIGDEQYYSVYIEYLDYKSPLYPGESHDDYYLDSGIVTYKILDSTTFTDQIVWEIQECLFINTMEWHLNALGNRDTSYFKISKISNYQLIEYTSGLHKLSCIMQILQFKDSVYRYSYGNNDTVIYKIKELRIGPIDYNVPYTFIKNRGLEEIIFCDFFSGNMSHINYIKRVKKIKTISHFSDIENKKIIFFLSQNYPNPFNPTTTIEYSFPERSNVSLKIFDVLGREVTTLVNEEKPAGNYNVELNASSLPSGVYFYRLEAGSFIEVKKFILMK